MVMFNLGYLDTCRQSALAVCPCHSCDRMFAGLEQLLIEVLTETTAGLAMVMSWRESMNENVLPQQWLPFQCDWSESWRS